MDTVSALQKCRKCLHLALLIQLYTRAKKAVKLPINPPANFYKECYYTLLHFRYRQKVNFSLINTSMSNTNHSFTSWKWRFNSYATCSSRENGESTRTSRTPRKTMATIGSIGTSRECGIFQRYFSFKS